MTNEVIAVLLRASSVRRFRKLAIVLIGLISIAHPANIYGENINIDESVCVRVIVQSSLPVNEQVTSINVKNGQVSRDDRPTIPPNAWLSPDRKTAFFLQAISETEIGLYLQSTSDGQPILLSTATREDLFSLLNTSTPPWAWSPDSSRFAYISAVQDKFALTLTDTTATLRKTQPLLLPKGPDYLIFHSWSADSAFIATSATELNIWSGNDLSLVGTDMSIPSGWQYTRQFIA
jgi:hypothetical protein